MSPTPHSLRRAIRIAVCCVLSILSGTAFADETGRVDLPRYPAISPDGTHITFTWRGGLWVAPTRGGTAARLTNNPANDLHSAWSADGSQIAFTSNRNGYLNIYIMNTDGTGIRQLTDIDRPCSLSGFGVDDNGRQIVTFSASFQGDVYREQRPYMVSVNGGDILRLHDAFGSSPAVSRDGTRIAFVRGGAYDGWTRRHYRGPEAMDVWLCDRRDGSFTQLTAFRGNDGRPKWLDNRNLLFLSDRQLNCVNLYRMSADRGEATCTRITSFQDDDIHGFDVAPDAATAVLAVWDTLYRLDLNDPNAQPEPIDLFATQDERDDYVLKNIGRTISEAALSPDGKVMAVTAYGEVYVRNVEEDSPTRRVTQSHAHERGLAWSPDGLKLYFTSDRTGVEAIYAATVALTRGEVKEAFEEAIGEPCRDAPDDHAEQDAPTPGDDQEPTPAQPSAWPPDPVSGIWQGIAQVPDADPLPYTLTLTLLPDNTVTGSLSAGPYSGAITGRYDPDAGSLELTASSADELVITFSLALEDGTLTGTATADDTTVDISATRAGEPEDRQETGQQTADEQEKEDEEPEEELPKELQPDRWHDAMTFNIEPVVQRDVNSRQPSPSPDGAMLAFRGTRGDIHIMNLQTREIRTLVAGWDAWVRWRWSADGKYLACVQSDMNFNRDIFIVRADGSAAPVNITRHPDNDSQPRWSADGKILSFVSERVDDELDVWMVYLDKDLEALTGRELKQYYEDAAKAAKKRKPLKIEPPQKQSDRSGDEPTAAGDDENDDDNADDDGPRTDEPEATAELDLEDAYLRVRRLTSLPGNESDLEMTPAGDRIVFNARGESPGLYSIKWDGSDKKRLTGNASVQHVSLTGDKLVLVSGSRAATIKPTGGGIEYVDVADRIRIDLQRQSSQKFLEAARTLGEQFYHPTMNGLDWPAVTEKYHDLARKARTAGEFNWVANRFVGELNGSHLGISAREPSPPNRQSYGRLGTVHRRVEDGFEITAIVPDSPADMGPMALEIGDVITAVAFEPFAGESNLETALKDRVGEETAISIRRTLDDGAVVDLDVLLTPISYYALRRLQYNAWRRENARLVDRWSHGRLGYIHVQSMSQSSLVVFERDLFAAADGRDGLILDVRNNGGGWTADLVLASITVQPHAYTIPRGADPQDIGHYPQDRLFIQRYAMPMNLLCNEKSYSNAEIIAHAFKTLKRGTLVGQQTHGSVISTGGFRLIDGTFVRLPFRAWYVSGGGGPGVNMELNGAVPDLLVPQTPQAEVRGEDEQLRAAVDDLLQRLTP